MIILWQTGAKPPLSLKKAPRASQSHHNKHRLKCQNRIRIRDNYWFGRRLRKKLTADSAAAATNPAKSIHSQESNPRQENRFFNSMF